MATVLSTGSILASGTGMMGGQQILHVIHTIPSVNVPGGMGMGHLQTIPVVVQSLPVVYTAVPAATANAAAAASAGDSGGNNGLGTTATAAITVPLIGSDGRSEGSGEIREREGGQVCVCVVCIRVFESLLVCWHVCVNVGLSPLSVHSFI